MMINDTTFTRQRVKNHKYKLLLFVTLALAALMLAKVSRAKAEVPAFAGVAVTAKADSVYKVVEQMPEIEGGLPELYKHITYPREAMLSGTEGRVFISFVVDKSGNAINPKILRDIGSGCGDAAIEAVQKVHFKPGRQNGKVVQVQYSLPVTFRLQK